MSHVKTRLVADDVHQIPLGFVNAYIVRTPDFLVLIDTGFPGSAKKIFSAVEELGYLRTDIAHVVLTHAHPDHIGSAAEIVRVTGAKTWMHPADIEAARTGARPAVQPSPGILPKLLFAAMHLMPGRAKGFEVDNTLHDGELLPFADLRAFHAPGHCKGQVVLQSETRSLLFAADSCMNLRGLRVPLVNEDANEALRSLQRISKLEFGIACFGHGQTIFGDASVQFRRTFS